MHETRLDGGSRIPKCSDVATSLREHRAAAVHDRADSGLCVVAAAGQHDHTSARGPQVTASVASRRSAEGRAGGRSPDLDSAARPPADVTSATTGNRTG